MSRFGKFVGFVAGALLMAAAHGTAVAQGAVPNDVARFLAGLPPSDGSPLTPLTQNPTWQRHARWFDSNWNTFEQRQLSHIRAWSERNLRGRRSTLYYMFSGPDFLYANAFFPEASNYLLSGLEPVGAIPTVNEHAVGALGRIQKSVASSLHFSFFITKKMRTQLAGGSLSGTLPILYAYIARSGKTIREVTLVNLDKNGTLHPATGEVRGMAPGVKIVLSTANGPPQNLYYFSTDLSNSGVMASGFLKFAATFGNGDALLKSASYLMHSTNFTQVRDFVLNNSQSIVQDDSGIPLAAFKPDLWDFQLFGSYLGPIDLFPHRSQSRLRELFKQAKAPPLDFGIGYRHRGHDSNLMLATRKAALGQPTPQAIQVPRPPRELAAEEPTGAVPALRR